MNRSLANVILGGYETAGKTSDAKAVSGAVSVARAELATYAQCKQVSLAMACVVRPVLLLQRLVLLLYVLLHSSARQLLKCVLTTGTES